jgi:hypothetical protein
LKPDGRNREKSSIHIATWPRLLDIHLASAYLSVGEATIRDYVTDRVLQPIGLPGSILRDRSGRVIAHAGARKIAKLLFDRHDLDVFIERMKETVNE